MRARLFASLEPFLGPPIDLVPQLVGEFAETRAFEPLLNEFAQLLQLFLVLFVEQSDRRLNGGVGVGVPAAVDQTLDLRLGFGQQRDAHASPPSPQTSKAARSWVAG